jgi:predicted DNA-binding antitoxin AbrB/MazE fold protein
MAITVEAVYENGVLKPMQPLPLKEHDRVQITIQPRTNWVQETYGICGWEGKRRGRRCVRYRPGTRLSAAAGGAMTFADLVAGDALFVDANILTYHFQPHPAWGPPCSDLLQRIENQELAGVTSTAALGEVPTA